MIRNSSEPDLYGDTAEMPKFADKLTPAQVDALAEFIVAQRGTPAPALTH